MVADSTSPPSTGSKALKSNIFLLGLLSILCACALSTVAAEDAPLSRKIDFVAWGPEIPNLTLKHPKTDQSFTAMSFRYSEAIDYQGPDLLELHQQNSSQGKGAGEPLANIHESDQKALSTASPPSQKPVSINKNENINPLLAELRKRREKDPTLVALIPLPQGCRHVTILLTQLDALTLKGYAINDDPSRLPAGKVRVHNLSRWPIALRCPPANPVELTFGQSLIATPTQGQFIYELSYRQGNRWCIQENNLLRIAANEQLQMFIIQSDHEFFAASDGTRSGFLQIAILRRSRPAP